MGLALLDELGELEVFGLDGGLEVEERLRVVLDRLTSGGGLAGGGESVHWEIELGDNGDDEWVSVLNVGVYNVADVHDGCVRWFVVNVTCSPPQSTQSLPTPHSQSPIPPCQADIPLHRIHTQNAPPPSTHSLISSNTSQTPPQPPPSSLQKSTWAIQTPTIQRTSSANSDQMATTLSQSIETSSKRSCKRRWVVKSRPSHSSPVVSLISKSAARTL